MSLPFLFDMPANLEAGGGLVYGTIVLCANFLGTAQAFVEQAQLSGAGDKFQP